MITVPEPIQVSEAHLMCIAVSRIPIVKVEPVTGAAMRKIRSRQRDRVGAQLASDWWELTSGGLGCTRLHSPLVAVRQFTVDELDGAADVLSGRS